MRGFQVGSMVGATGGLVFVIDNAGEFADPWRLMVRLLGIAVAIVVVAIVMRTPVRESGAPSPNARRIYGWSVLAMVVAIPLGNVLLYGPLGAPEFTVLWVIAVVGAHFLPFASAFNAPIFRPLGLTLLALAAIGATATFIIGTSDTASLTAVVTGFVLLSFVARGALTAVPER